MILVCFFVVAVRLDVLYIFSMTTHSHAIVVLDVVSAHSLSNYFLSSADPFFILRSRIASCLWNLRVPSGVVVITIMPCTEICFCSLSMRILFNGISQVVLR